ncbi:hypothetical protein [Azospirillum brasilense]|uniref:hypothetical protein n=1 Tax=Azospirillum brasilense TaxID=192 RepID=UPI001FFFB08F|nr:hypothetical protein [Azospirillum brasilense]
MSAVREVEMKLHLDPRDLPRVADLPALKEKAEGAPTVRNLRTVYYDTPDRRLFLGAWPCGCGRTATASSRR